MQIETHRPYRSAIHSILFRKPPIFEHSLADSLLLDPATADHSSSGRASYQPFRPRFGPLGVASVSFQAHFRLASSSARVGSLQGNLASGSLQARFRPALVCWVSLQARFRLASARFGSFQALFFTLASGCIGPLGVISGSFQARFKLASARYGWLQARFRLATGSLRFRFIPLRPRFGPLGVASARFKLAPGSFQALARFGSFQAPRLAAGSLQVCCRLASAPLWSVGCRFSLASGSFRVASGRFRLASRSLQARFSLASGSLVSLLPRFGPLGDIQARFRLTSGSLQARFRLAWARFGLFQARFRFVSSLQARFRVASVSLWSAGCRLWLASGSLQARFRLASGSLQARFRLASGSLQARFSLAAGSLQARFRFALGSFEWVCSEYKSEQTAGPKEYSGIFTSA
jgi:hypothetical protein